MKKFLFWLGSIFISYVLVAGLAWSWVLGLRFSFWKLLVIALLQCSANLAQQVIYTRFLERKK